MASTLAARGQVHLHSVRWWTQRHLTRRGEERGSLSIEQVIIAGVLLTLALLVTAAIAKVVNTNLSKIK